MDVDVKPESRLVPSSFSTERLSLVEDIDKDDQVFSLFCHFWGHLCQRNWASTSDVDVF